MADDVAITTNMDAVMHDALVAEAEARQTSPEEIVRDLIGDFVSSRHDYDIFLRRKVEAARRSAAAGIGMPDKDVEAEFAAKRARVALEG